MVGAVANNSGAYTISVPPGTYVPFALAPGTNYIVNFSTTPTLTLGSSQTITTNLTVTNATAVVSGKIVDASNSSLGLPGVFMSANSKIRWSDVLTRSVSAIPTVILPSRSLPVSGVWVGMIRD